MTLDDVSVYHRDPVPELLPELIHDRKLTHGLTDARARLPLATPLPEGSEKMELVQPLRKLSLSQNDRSICKYNHVGLKPTFFPATMYVFHCFPAFPSNSPCLAEGRLVKAPERMGPLFESVQLRYKWLNSMVYSRYYSYSMHGVYKPTFTSLGGRIL